MTFSYDSANTKDNENRKFQPDSSGDVAVNIKSKDIVDAIESTQSVVKTAPKISNILIPNSNTEQEFEFSANTKSISLRVRELASLKFCFLENESNTNYVTLSSGSSFEESGLNVSGLKIYFQSNRSNVTLEIIEWS
jgi:hypothetical protein